MLLDRTLQDEVYESVCAPLIRASVEGDMSSLKLLLLQGAHVDHSDAVSKVNIELEVVSYI